MNEIPIKFIETYIMKECRDRVKHEWKNKPEKLFYKVCHSPEELFKNEYKGRSPAIELNEKCFFLFGRKVNQSLYSEADKFIGSGSGMLVISVTGDKFYAESESTKGYPFVSYASE